jgi:Protein of unknown function (DUF1553)/Protein of unknown function (DUF1549)/Concanavalin A-like lectin/glucanases superfamily/Planctomycete cytochrome C
MGAGLLAASFNVGAAPGAQKPAGLVVGKLTYNKDIRPILADNCFPCHGPDSAARKAGLRLDRLADARAKGAIVPGDPLASEVLRRIRLPQSDALTMPPAAGHKRLTPEQVALLTRWIGEGAQYEQHWSYLAPKPQTPPKVKNAAWVRSPIDAFVLAKLEEKGLTPAPEADRRTLARRLALDLTGLPPAPADVEAFVADKAPNAYEKLVDKLMATPQWGEHRGRYWLDAARYADTHGIHFDNYREMWAYRDWVIQAFNQNMRFDQFTTEQLAGDLLPEPTLDQRIATGFTRCNITTNEGGSIDEEVRVMYTRDRTETAAQVWLGSTAGCAVCHDHKFDPLSQKDFYSLSAFFNNTTQNAMDGNIKDTPPIIQVPVSADRPRFAALQKELAEAKRAAEARKASAKADFDKWLAAPTRTALAAPTEGLIFQAKLDEGKGKEIAALREGQPVKYPIEGGGASWPEGQLAEKAFQKKPGGSVALPDVGDFDSNQAFTCSAWVKLSQGSSGGAIVARMDEGNEHRGWDMWVEGNKVGSHIIHKWPGDALKVMTQEALTVGVWHLVAITYDGSLKRSGLKVYVDGIEKATDAQAESLKNTIKTTTPFKLAQRSGGAVIEGLGLQDVRLYSRALPANEVAALLAMRSEYLLALGSGKLKPAQRDELFSGWLASGDPVYKELSGKLASLQSEEAAIKGRGTVAHVANEKPSMPEAYVLFRGEYDKRRDKVVPMTPAALPAMSPALPKNRLGLAKWLLAPGHPLTARVTVNRYWQELFGTGLVKTAGDFGITGELPSHPELLDWLALDFQRDWNIKRFFKQLVMSSTYRQAALLTPEKRAKDRDNRLLSRGPRYRMDGEMVRDYALAVSGLLVKKIGGPSVKPYQPDGVWEAVAMIGSNTRDYRRDTGESLYRRSMYTLWKRAAPPASMELFNAPNRETCTVKRERTNTPLQALVTLNDIQFVEAARHLATSALKSGNALDFIARRLLSRPLTTTERLITEATLEELKAHYDTHPKEARELITFGESKPDSSLNTAQLAAWTMLANQMLNLDEVLNK